MSDYKNLQIKTKKQLVKNYEEFLEKMNSFKKQIKKLNFEKSKIEELQMNTRTYELLKCLFNSYSEERIERQRFQDFQVKIMQQLKDVSIKSLETLEEMNKNNQDNQKKSLEGKVTIIKLCIASLVCFLFIGVFGFIAFVYIISKVPV